MTELVAKMAEQRAVGLAHLRPQFFAFGRVGFRDIQRDQPVVMAGENMFAAGSDLGRVGEEVERQSGLVGRIALRLDRQTVGEQRIDRPLLGRLDARPAIAVAVDRQVRDGLVEGTGAAKTLPLRRAPVAVALIDIDAEKDVVASGQHEIRLIGIIKHQAAAIKALGVLEIQAVAAMRAGKKLHEGCSGKFGATSRGELGNAGIQ